MNAFAYTAPATLEEALAALQAPGACALAGGTDLLVLARRGVLAPQHLVSLRSVPDLAQIRQTSDGGLSIGALARLSRVAEHPLVAGQYPLLVQAILQIATPQVRNAGTLGGNLCQRPRCWYFRHPDFPCARKQGQGCFAVAGQSRHHAILGGRDCFIVHPSDLAPALLALDALAHIAGPGGNRVLPLADFFVGPDHSLAQETVLQPGELLTAIQLPPPRPGSRGLYLKAAERQAADFALASAALLLVADGAQVVHARIVLGGVAPMPWRARRAEAVLLTEGLSREAIRRVGEAAVEGARPLPHNGYKVELVRGLLRKGLRQLGGGTAG